MSRFEILDDENLAVIALLYVFEGDERLIAVSGIHAATLSFLIVYWVKPVFDET